LANKVNFPQDDNRTLVLGRTGSGKSVFAIWLLSSRSFHSKPWIIFDSKNAANDVLMNGLEDLGVPEIDIKKRPPVKPGLYIARPKIEDPVSTNRFLMDCWRQEETGLFFDEGFAIPQHRPFNAFDYIMIQGRSKNVPVIACYQRPRLLSQQLLSNIEFFAVFHLLKPEDRELIDGYVGYAEGPNGEEIDVNYKLPKHFCLWYDVNEDKATVLRPCPGPDAILEIFAARLPKRKRGLFI